MAKHQLQLPGTLPSDAGVASSGWTFLRKTMFLSLGTIYKGRLHRKPKSWLSKGRCMNLLLEICPKCGQGGFRSPENFADVLYERSPGKNSTFATLGAIQSFHNNGCKQLVFFPSANKWRHSFRREKCPTSLTESSLARRVSELESVIVALQDQIAALNKELSRRWVREGRRKI